MPISERTPQKLVMRSGSTTLTLSKEAGTATLQRKLLFWTLKPSQAPLSDITEVNVEAAVDRASGVEVCSTMLIMRTGAGWAFPCSDKKDAQGIADAIRDFLGLSSRQGLEPAT
jgi:hypothetical protein